MNRIQTIYSLINENDKVVDIGCDQAKLGLLLSKRKQYSIAVDKSKKVIERAKHDIKNNIYLDIRLSDGLSNVKEYEADTAVLAGMGTYSIINILKNTNLRFNKIITISNTSHEVLKNKMNSLNYIVDKEINIKESKKNYILIVFIEK